jgi:PAS domain S-box-containing protein
VSAAPLPVDAEALAREIDLLRRRLQEGADGRELLEATLESLQTSVEELRIAEEQLLQQNDELVSAHLAVEAERQRFEDLYRFAPDAYLITDEYGKVLDANVSATAIFGVQPNYLVGKPLATFLEPASRAGFRQLLLDIGARREVSHLELRMHRRDRVTFDAAITVMAVHRAHTDSTISLRWLVRNVSEQRQAEERLWELNTELESRVTARTAELAAEGALLEAVLDQLPVGVIIADAPSGRVSRSNRYANELLGRSVEATGVSDYAGFELHDEQGRKLAELDTPLARAVRRGEEIRNARVTLRRPDASLRTISTSTGIVRDAAGEIVAAVAVLEDMTERERREQADRDFVTNAAHELRTPLAAIASSVEVLQAGAKEQPAERDLFLDHIERESRRLSRLARALLLLARVQTGAETPRVEIVALRPLLREVAAATRPAEGVRVAVRCGAGVAALTNRDLLEQALANLTGNAAQHTARGSISISARAAPGGDVIVQVADTGPGLSAATRERMFERFYRGGARDAEGFGLGLAIAQQALEAVGGSIEVETVEGKGTTMRMRLPFAQLVER